METTHFPISCTTGKPCPDASFTILVGRRSLNRLPVNQQLIRDLHRFGRDDSGRGPPASGQRGGSADNYLERERN
ncbi:hypothetical protein CEXT_269381 [Caerostris extrusa]|uniref:Uncharacterized protein n=1 Tax=Caerostris extrusa TaxID=172846 RepID=A0AAV4SCU2_CAEEX|nr:hypothetical protein CEXT_269381 [Caerostris extrusa]